MNSDYLAWGRFYKFKHEVVKLNWLNDDFTFMQETDKKILPYGYGRSYGDSCLNGDGMLIDTRNLDRVISFDHKNGIIRCEAGISLAEILKVIIPFGWFLPVTPGTKFVSLGGAIANDVHGKNHHKRGTIGCFVKCFELVTSELKNYLCSPSQNKDLFEATIGGLGLTGLITWIEISLIKASPYIAWESIKFKNLDEFFNISEEDQDFEYTVAWVDLMAKGAELGRGIYMRGNHSERDGKNIKITSAPTLKMPFCAPNFLLNEYTIKAFNNLYYFKQRSKVRKIVGHYNPFFYPLDIIDDWNKIYGDQGFFQYQFVIPKKNIGAISKVFEIISDSGMGSFLAVLKRFGDIASPGMLSFPSEGITLSLDFINRQNATKQLFTKIDEVISNAQGRLYPAKDAFMRAKDFKQFYPNWEKFLTHKDGKFSSSFARRVFESV